VLMVSRLPVFSGKSARMRVPPEMLLPVFVSVIFFIALLISYPWHILSAMTVMYLLCLPIGWKSYRDQERKLTAQGVVPSDVASAPGTAPSFGPVPNDGDSQDRPSRLN
jgi:CDP-diacylglycerol--serine O-phosphatidyltransferase